MLATVITTLSSPIGGGALVMPSGVVRRPAEWQAVSDFLSSTEQWPAALVLEGEPGIGKTTLWLAAIDHARKNGFAVLTARAASAETVLGYAALTDLLSEVDQTAFADLPDPQRIALDQALLRRRGTDGAATDQRAVAAGFLSVVERLTDTSTVLVAIDDLQWLDGSSRNVVAFAARRFYGRVGLLGTVRIDAHGDHAAWPQLREPDAIKRIRLGPLRLASLHAVISERLGVTLPRPAIVRIHEVSGGNPFYALELARTVMDRPHGAEAALPGTLAEVVDARIGNLDAQVREALLAAACMAEPTVELVARATGADAGHVVELLEDAQANGIVAIDGQWIGFAHPLLARGVYLGAALARRRAMHRRLAEILDEPELHARHLALSVAKGDPRTLHALDAAADIAGSRGAPAAAAELLELALKLGDDTPERRIMLAQHLFSAGDAERVRAVLAPITTESSPRSPLRAQALMLLGVMEIFDRASIADVLQRALDEAGDDVGLRAQILIPLSFALYNIDEHAAAARAIADAVTSATRLRDPQLLSQALGMQALLRFLLGKGLDEKKIHRALNLENPEVPAPVVCRPRVHHAILLACSGQLDKAHGEFVALRHRCIERGEEIEHNFVAFYSLLNEIWRADFAEAALLAEDAMERALPGDTVSNAATLIMRAYCAAYAGHSDDARGDASQALRTVEPFNISLLTVWPTTILGFVYVSLGEYQTALNFFEPLLCRFHQAPQATEIYVAPYLPDAVDAMIALGRLDEAEPLIDALQRNGRRLDRAWMLAIGARCRAMLLAAHGDLSEACEAAEQAMAQHRRLHMPFESARTQLVLGQLQRRLREKDVSAATLREALKVFEQLDTPLWADRARAELQRVKVGPQPRTVLTPSEQRVAELAATGMTSRDVAARLFISPKTVEANISRIYHKLGIRSRAELGRVMDQSHHPDTTTP